MCGCNDPLCACNAAPVKMHVSINVSNLDRSLAFYEAFFGVPPHKVRPGYANFDLATPPLKFADSPTTTVPILN